MAEGEAEGVGTLLLPRMTPTLRGSACEIRQGDLHLRRWNEKGYCGSIQVRRRGLASLFHGPFSKVQNALTSSTRPHFFSTKCFPSPSPRACPRPATHEQAARRGPLPASDAGCRW